MNNFIFVRSFVSLPPFSLPNFMSDMMDAVVIDTNEDTIAINCGIVVLWPFSMVCN